VWWEGDPDKLAAFYGGGTGTQSEAAASRWKRAWKAFWSGIQTESDPRRLHVPVAGDIGRIAGGVLFAEPVRFLGAETEKDDLRKHIDARLNIPDVHSRLLVGAESAAMLSGTYGRIVWDDRVSDYSWIDFVDADRAIPTFVHGYLTGVIFWTELAVDSDRVVMRHLQHYTKGRIEHALYEGTKNNIGHVVPLAEHPDTAGIKLSEGDATGISTGVDEIAAAYFPHRRPDPAWRNEPKLKNLGRADLTRDVIQLFDAIDKTWSSWMNDLDLGRARIIVSESMLKTNGAGQGSSFDLDRSIYSPVGNMLKEGDMTSVLQAEQFEIRTEEHNTTFENLLRRVISRLGYSPLTFGMQDEVAITATEVDAKERDTATTRAARIRLWSPGISHLATVQMRIDAKLRKTPEPKEPIEVDWPPMHQQSDRQRAETAQLWEQARAATTLTKVKLLHPDWDDQRAEAEANEIDKANTVTVAEFPGESGALGPDDREESGTEPTEPVDPAQ
jgi:hypothetical protein